MKKVFTVLAVAVIVTLAGNDQVLAQNKGKSNGTLEIIDVFAPNFIIFKPAEGKEIKNLYITFQDSLQFMAANRIKATNSHNITNSIGLPQTVYTDQSVIRAMDFKIPSVPDNSHLYSSFTAKKLTFSVDGEKMRYDLGKSAWETDESEPQTAETQAGDVALNATGFNQNGNVHKSNGTLNILTVYAPDFIIFKPAEGNKIKRVAVSFVSGKRSYRGARISATAISLDKNFEIVYSDKSEISISGFDAPDDFEAQEIRFVVDGKAMYYDLAQSAWESDPKKSRK
ncbi:MAG: hypothetical protein LBL24_09110 [Bacteroidales bacterium]|nr:hypothetical protein [Bacteroidales bacterium]